MVIKTKVKTKQKRSEAQRIVEDELRKGAAVYDRDWLYRTTRSGGEIQTNRRTGERWLLHRVKPEVVRKLN